MSNNIEVYADEIFHLRSFIYIAELRMAQVSWKTPLMVTAQKRSRALCNRYVILQTVFKSETRNFHDPPKSGVAAFLTA